MALATDVETGLLMLLGPIRFWFLRSTVREVGDWLERPLGQAVLLFAWTDTLREKIGHERPPIEQASIERDLAAVRSKLNDSAFDGLLQEGRTMSIEDAVILVL